MKTKLLKKIRTRYSILYVEYIKSENESVLKNLFAYYDSPYYVIRDEYRFNNIGDKYITSSKDYKEIYDKLISIIKNKYGNKRTRIIKDKITKIRW